MKLACLVSKTWTSAWIRRIPLQMSSWVVVESVAGTSGDQVVAWGLPHSLTLGRYSSW
jgi:hypothetical protein